MNKIIKNTLILAAITVVSGLVLGAAYEVTKGPIAQTQAKQKQEACQAVYPEADSFEAMDVDQKAAKEAIKKMGTNATVDEVYSAVMDGSEAGYVITVTDKDGYGGDIQITVGIMSDGTVGIDSLNGFVMEYDPESSDVLKIEFDDQQMSAFLHQFSQEIYDVKAEFGRKCWYITAAVTLLSAAIAYFVSGRALKPLKQFSKQTENINQDNLTSTRFDENTAAEFQQLSCSVNHMLDRLALSFDLQRQFAGNAAHELRTPLAMMQTKLELFAEEHSDSCAETAERVLVRLS